MMKRTISGMIGAGSLAHNRRDFVAENVDPDRVQLNICYQNENLKEVYKELFDDAVERYNVGKRKDWKIANYYEKIRQGKQEKLFHEVIFQIGNREDMAVGTSEGNLAAQVKELTRERDSWKSKFQKKKQEHEKTKKELAEVQKLSGEKEILQELADRYNRLLRMLGKDMVERLVQDDIRIQAELEAKKQKEQMPKKISDRIPWAKERSEEHNAQIKKNKAKYRGMEL